MKAVALQTERIIALVNRELNHSKQSLMPSELASTPKLQPKVQRFS